MSKKSSFLYRLHLIKNDNPTLLCETDRTARIIAVAYSLDDKIQDQLEVSAWEAKTAPEPTFRKSWRDVEATLLAG